MTVMICELAYPDPVMLMDDPMALLVGLRVMDGVTVKFAIGEL